MVSNYTEQRDNDKNKGVIMYIDRWPKAWRNIVGFMNNTWPGTTNKQPNYIFEGHERNHLLVCAIKSIVLGEELLINYNLNRIEIYIAIMGEICNLSLMTLIFYVCHSEE